MKSFKVFGLLVWCFALAMCPITTFAQETDDETIKINSALVSLEVLVTDKRTGARIDGLKRENFEVSDDGRPQTLTFFSSGAEARQPLAFVLLTDLNLYSMSKLQKLRLRSALRRALWSSLQTGDQVAVITLSPDLKIVKTLGHDRQGVLESLTPTTESRDGQPQPFRRTDIVAGLLAAIQHVRERRQQFRLGIVVVGEKPFGTLQQAEKDSIDGLLASGAVVNVIRNSEGKNDLLGYICEQTGGEIINIRGTDYSDALERVLDNLPRRYSIGFIPDNAHQDGRFHKLDVAIRVPATSGRQRVLEARARRGYTAVAPTSRIER
jgi:Ca-activated chloride channel family protein